MTTAAEVYAVAAVVYDQVAQGDSHSEADLNFIYAVNAATKEWADRLNAAKRDWNGDLEVWEVIRNLATKSREVALVRALAELESHDDEAFGILQAAE